MKIAEKAHAKFSASGSKRWLNCPGSIALTETAIEKFGNPPESAAAKEGTEAHHCLESLLKNRKTIYSTKRALEKTFPKEMVEHAFHAAQTILQKVADVDGELLCETEVDSSSFTCEGQFGTVDAAVVELFTELTVYDFKYGQGIDVAILDNEQLIYYALGIAHKYDYNFEKVTIVILQPRTGDGEPKSQTFEIEELRKWRERFLLGVKAAQRSDAPLKAGTWCQWCPATPICSEVSNRQLEAARVVFNDDLTEMGFPIIKREKLGETLTAIEKLETWIASVKEFAFNELSHGRPVEGFKLVEKRPTRKWIDPEKTAIEAKRLWKNKAFKTELLSPAQIEKFELGLAKAFVEKRTVLVSSGLTIAPLEDKRPETSSAAFAFKELPDLTKKQKGKSNGKKR